MELAYVQEIERTGSRSRPRQRWKNNMKDDLEDLGVKNREKKARNRDKWRQILSAPKCLKDLECRDRQQKYIFIHHMRV